MSCEADIAIDIPYFRSILLRDKHFLYELYDANILEAKRLISGASDLHLKTLIKVLHLVINNCIPIPFENGEAIKKLNKFPVLKKHFLANRSYANLIRSAREVKVNVLMKFSSIFNLLLTPLFVEEK